MRKKKKIISLQKELDNLKVSNPSQRDEYDAYKYKQKIITLDDMD